MKRWRVSFSGCRIGAIGMHYPLHPITVYAENKDDAEKRASEVMYEEYEHLSLLSVSECPEKKEAENG